MKQAVIDSILECGYEEETAEIIYNSALDAQNGIPQCIMFDTPNYIFIIRNITIIDTYQTIEDYDKACHDLVRIANNKQITLYALQHYIIRTMQQQPVDIIQELLK
jgi:hypothetical protein